MGIKFSNFAASTIAVGLAPGDVTIALTGGTGARFPTLGVGDFFYAVLENSSLAREAVQVTARTGDTLTVVRAQEGTTALSWVAGDSIAQRVTAGSFAAILDAAEVAGAAGAAAIYDTFDDRWLGAKASNPTLDNDGNALQVGAAYWSTTSSVLRVWTGTIWTDSSIPGGVIGVGAGGTGATAAAAARANLGAAAAGSNADITSLAAPALGAATATTQAANTANTTVATTAFVDQLRSLLAPTTGTSGTLAIGDRGTKVKATGGITVPASVFADNDVVTIYNDSAASITIIQGSGLTLRQVGTAATGNRTLALRGLATVVFNSATEAVISGGGLS